MQLCFYHGQIIDAYIFMTWMTVPRHTCQKGFQRNFAGNTEFGASFDNVTQKYTITQGIPLFLCMDLIFPGVPLFLYEFYTPGIPLFLYGFYTPGIPLFQYGFYIPRIPLSCMDFIFQEIHFSCTILYLFQEFHFPCMNFIYSAIPLFLYRFYIQEFHFS